jgi:hypothetical protein
VIAVTLLCATLGAQILRPGRAVPEGAALLTAQERFLTDLHPALSVLYMAGVFLAILGTLYGAYQVYTHTFVESLKAVAPRAVTERTLPSWRRAVVAYCFIGGLAMIWLPEAYSRDVTGRMTFGSILGGGIASGLWCFAMLWADRTRLPASLRMGRGLRTLLWIAGLFMLALGAQTAFVYFR